MKQILDRYFAIIKKALPDNVAEPAVGIDIGTTECKMIQIRKVDDVYELMCFAIEPITNGDVATSIQQGLSKLGQGYSKSIYTSLFGRGTLIRHINLPRMSLEDLKNSFEIESEKYFPFAADQIYTDCCILDPEEKSKQMSVMAAAAKRELVNKRMDLLKNLGLQVNHIALNPVALANVVNVLGWGDGEDQKQEDRGLTAIFNIGTSMGNLSIIADRQLRFTRDIYIGGKDLTTSIVHGLEVNVQAVEALKSNPGDKQEEILTACESVLMNMAQEIRLSFDYFMTEKEGDIQRLFITGGVSMLPGLAETLGKFLDVDVQCWNPLKRLKMSEHVTQEVNQQSVRMGAALGMALYHYD